MKRASVDSKMRQPRRNANNINDDEKLSISLYITICPGTPRSVLSHGGGKYVNLNIQNFPRPSFPGELGQ